MSIPVLDPNIFGYPLQQGYSFDSSNKSTITRAFRGPARHRLRNPGTTNQMLLQFHWSDEALREFKAFWNYTLDYGKEWFAVNLLMDVGIQTFEAHATAPYLATSVSNVYWQVGLQVEVKDDT